MSIAPHHIISASLSPNTQLDDILLAWRILVNPWTWRNGSAVSDVEGWFQERYSSSAVSFNSGRSALLAILHSFGIGQKDEVLVQSFSCVAVANSVLWIGATPIFVDVDTSLNIDVGDAERKITKRTKAIIVQHTFGIPASMDRIMAYAKKHSILVIEDCAHALGATYHGKPLGSIGDAAFFSFGRDKVISSVFGGMAIINSKFKIQNSELHRYQQNLPYPSLSWIAQQLFHPIAFSIILPLYTLGIGKLILYILQRLRVLSFPVYKEEKFGKRPNDFPKRYPNSLAKLLSRQLNKVERYNRTRKHVAAFYHDKLNLPYNKEAIYLRFPCFVENPEKMIQRAKRHNIILGNWYHAVIDPQGVDFQSIGYQLGSCPHAEYYAKHIINLPTRISHADAKRIVSVL